MNQYKYGIEHYTGDSFEDADTFSSNTNYDLNDDFDREMLAEEIASEYWHDHGFEAVGWGNNEYSVKFYIWTDDGKKYEYDVWVEMVPHFSAISKT